MLAMSALSFAAPHSIPRLSTPNGRLKFLLVSHENINNLTPADVYTGRGQTILLEREKTKRRTMKQRRLQHARHAA
jgi:hypothetical protein